MAFVEVPFGKYCPKGMAAKIKDWFLRRTVVLSVENPTKTQRHKEQLYVMVS